MNAVVARMRVAERWSRLPRDARDTLFLLGVIGWTILPHLPNLPLWCALLALTLLAWRGVLAVQARPLPSRVWLVVLLALATLLTWQTHGTLVGKDAGVTMAVVLMGLKTLELRARRDAFVVFFLGFFLVLTHFFYSQTILTAAAMLVATWGLMTALVLAHMPAGRPALARAGAQALRAALAGAPLMLLLFVLFPRIGPLWGVPQEMVGKTGLSGTMQLGAMAEIANDDSIAFRVRFVDGSRAPQPAAMYWRGPVLTTFDGREWRSMRPPPASTRAVQVSGAPLHYEMTLEPSRLPLLPLLEATPSPPVLADDDPALRPQRRDDLTWTMQRPLLERLRLRATAYPTFRHGPAGQTWDLREALELPPGHNPRTLDWADGLRADPTLANADADRLANAVLQHIRTGNFSYTLSPGVYGERDARTIVDEFWLDRKAGFCEHYAAAFVVIMRALDVPARIVTGYQGADPLVVDGFHTVRQSYAHAWAEYWREGVGWKRADPTAAVAPDRIQRSIYLQPQRGAVAGALNAMNPNLLASLRAGWEAVDNRWNQWVLNYSRGQQLQTLRQLGFDGADWQDLALMLIVALSGLALAAAAWAWFEHHRQDPWARLLARMRRALERAGVPAPAHAGPLQWAAQLRERDDGAALAAWLAGLDRARYGTAATSRPSHAAWREFVRQTRALRRR
jgi:transglutaminase-like putative cysteine protease